MEAVHNGMQGDADGGRGQDWRLPATPAASHAPVWRGVALAVFRAQNWAAEARGGGGPRELFWLESPLFNRNQ